MEFARRGRKGNLVLDQAVCRLAVTLDWDRSRDQEVEMDCDLSAFLFVGDHLNSKRDVVYFANTCHSSKAVVHSGDNLTGWESPENEKMHDETITLDLKALSTKFTRYDKIIFVVSIYDAKQRGQAFDKARNAVFRVYDEDAHKLLWEFNLTKSLPGETGVKAARVYREGTVWKFQQDGTPISSADGVSQVAKALQDFPKKDI